MQLYVIIKDERYGFIYEDGSIAISPRFESALTFSCGLAGVRLGGKWGYVDRTGEFVVSPRFDSCRPHSCGLALVECDERKEYVDVEGEVAFQADFDECGSFVDDLAHAVTDMDCDGVFIDRKGRVVLSGRGYLTSRYSHGLINCSEGAMYGFVDRSGEFQIPPVYGYACHFAESLAAVALRGDSDFCFIDTDGEIVIDGSFHGADIEFSEGLCAVWDGMYGYIDKAGQLEIPYQFYYADHFSNGLAVVRTSEAGLYGYADRSGAMVIEERFLHASPFAGDLAGVVVGDSWDARRHGLINRDGEYVWEPTQ